mmetsp:Transcript_7827/g.12448  ORF Transcript_7827/g.12448 Transcript_7827/m.12448 type:complete len:136 (-) Transcript_7827:6-413(-)|eukprot:CAMPEP_0184319238 /NCGR_PEP_ID=MMETSP1049-20130417/107234_1 /TAXON_ID=77928 /ORGANISM="Proteomonas sulcata, Strain CCMP704" /LENGTH=135 /DNA_ID=CAMNT_0026639295 /DNA_START=73 /DNA_END=476 /DNA_ORIENTATION=+
MESWFEEAKASGQQLMAYFVHEDLNLRVARQMWWIGWLGLPMMWMLNWMNFRKLAAEPDAPRELKLLVNFSLIGAFSAIAIMVGWITYYQSVKETLVCPCDSPFGSDFRCHCTLGDQRVFPVTTCVSTNGQCQAL